MWDLTVELLKAAAVFRGLNLFDVGTYIHTWQALWETFVTSCGGFWPGDWLLHAMVDDSCVLCFSLVHAHVHPVVAAAAAAAVCRPFVRVCPSEPSSRAPVEAPLSMFFYVC